MVSMSELVVVCGAAGALGRAVVGEFCARDAQVAALDRPGEALSALGDSDAAVHPVAADLADPAAVAQAWSQVDSLGTPAALVVVAGGFAGGGLAELEPATFQSMINTNLATVLWSARAAAARMRASGGGSIITIGSRTGVTGAAGGGPVAYGLAKAAVIRLTELLADELRPDKIRVNCVLPSVIDTPANRSWMPSALVAKAVAPEAIAKVIAFLCSADAWPINGAAIPVYGDA
jgi:NAD(P)-dependent dehydrogenase (short-subunit alcohol dehydrogenase family)